MKNFGTVERDKLNPDGSVRNKYDLPETKPSKGLLRLATAFLVGNTLLVLKNIFFADEASAENDRPGTTKQLGNAQQAGRAAEFNVIEGRGSESDEDRGASAATLPASEAPGDEASFVSQDTDLSSGPTNIVSFPAQTEAGDDQASLPPASIGADGEYFDINVTTPDAAPSGGGGGRGQGDDERPYVNRLPVVASVPVALGDLYFNHSVAIAMTDLLRGAFDPDGDPLEIRNLTASSGRLIEDGDGAWQFEATSALDANVTFTFEVADGHGGTTHTANLQILGLPGEDILGTPQADVLDGTERSDFINALDGDDQIRAGRDDDVIIAGSGDDVVDGGDGDDIIYAGAGNDTVSAGAGDDVVFGGAGDDVISGDAGDDSLFGGDGNDTIGGGADNDTVVGDAGHDRLAGDAGNDLVLGGTGNDDISGGDGNDTLIGGAHDDAIAGDDGDDVIVALADDGDDQIDGGSGTDTYDASLVQDDVNIDLEQETANGATIGTDTVMNVENVVGGSGSDKLVGNGLSNILSGGVGDDALDGGDGNDTLLGGDGSDTVLGGAGDDTIVAAANDGDDRIDGGDGTDILDAAATEKDATIDLSAGFASSDDLGFDQVSSVENVSAGQGNDVVIGSDVDNNLAGNAGNDILDGGAGNDQLSGGTGDDTFAARTGDGDDDIEGGLGVDTYDASAIETAVAVDLAAETASGVDIGSDRVQSIENIVGGRSDDELSGNGTDNVIQAGLGDDVVDGGGGNDTLEGGGGDDWFVATEGDGFDSIDGGDGADTYDASRITEDLSVDLSRGEVSGGGRQFDDLQDIENAFGGSGNDRLIASDAVNVLRGGEGRDIFVFLEANKKGPGGHWRDRIEDFEVGDKIDLSLFDGNRQEDGFQRLTFNFSDTEFNGIGQAWVRYPEDGGSEAVTILQFKLDDDDVEGQEADFEIEIVGRHGIDEDTIVL